MPRRFWVVDDAPVIQKGIQIAFADNDVEVELFQSHAEIQSKLEAGEKPAMIFSSSYMPDTDEEVAFKKTLEHVGSIPILILTATFDLVKEKDLKALGLKYFLKKPFEPAELNYMVAKDMGVTLDGEEPEDEPADEPEAGDSETKVEEPLPSAQSQSVADDESYESEKSESTKVEEAPVETKVDKPSEISMLADSIVGDLPSVSEITQQSRPKEQEESEKEFSLAEELGIPDPKSLASQTNDETAKTFATSATNDADAGFEGLKKSFNWDDIDFGDAGANSLLSSKNVGSGSQVSSDAKKLNETAPKKEFSSNESSYVPSVEELLGKHFDQDKSKTLEEEQSLQAVSGEPMIPDVSSLKAQEAKVTPVPPAVPSEVVSSLAQDPSPPAVPDIPAIPSASDVDNLLSQVPTPPKMSESVPTQSKTPDLSALEQQLGADLEPILRQFVEAYCKEHLPPLLKDIVKFELKRLLNNPGNK